MGIPSFNGGAVGFFSYDTVRLYENIPDKNEDDLGLPDLHFMLTDELIAFDHNKNKIDIIVNIHVSDNLEEAYSKACRRIDEIREEMEDYSSLKTSQKPARGGKVKIESNMTKDEFCKKIERAKKYIEER